MYNLSLQEFNSENYDAIIESFSPSPIPVEDSDSLMEEIDLFLTPDDSMPPGIENDDYDSEGDILFLEELLSNDSPSLHENESFHFDFPSSPRPPAKPPDDGIYFEPDTGVFTKVVDDISDNSTRELIVHVPNVLPNLPTLSPMFDTLLPFSSENDDKVFNHGILASNEEKSPHLLSHRGFKAFQIIREVFVKLLLDSFGKLSIRRSKQRVEPFSLEESLVFTMADQYTMAELLQAPTEGYGDAIVIPAILAENFELKRGLLNLVTSKQFYGFKKEDPHAHIPRIWLEKDPPCSILTWEDLVSMFINQFFPPSKTINLRNEITNFQQRFDESFCEAWDRFKDLLRACTHHGFTKLHQLDTFYNSLTPTDQDSLNAAAGGNLLTKTPQDALTIIENKSKVRNSRNNPIVSKVSTNASSSTPHSPEIAALVDAIKAMLH
ncbi:reverse transcriptase domain-containing protein [Tanacetum coccineum]